MPHHVSEILAPAPSPSDLPLTLASLTQVCYDVAFLTARYGSTSAACTRLDELERANHEHQAQLATLHNKLNMAMVSAAAAQVDLAALQQDALLQGTRPLNVEAFMAFLQRHCACRGDLTLLFSVLADYQRHVEAPGVPLPPRDVLISVHEIVPVPSTGAGPEAGTDPAVSMVHDQKSPVPFDRARTHQREVTSLTPKFKGKTKASGLDSHVHANVQRQNGNSGSGPGSETRVASASQQQAQLTPAKRTRLATMNDVLVKQNLPIPQDKRNVTELRQSSHFVTLVALDALRQVAPWDLMYQHRASYSHIIDSTSCHRQVRDWFVHVLQVQRTWRREFWERLHWLPMSEAVCTGANWDKIRQTRKRRANKAIAAWRKVYAESVELMRDALLPDDVWCDVALWYMPATPLSWLPTSRDLSHELMTLDHRQPVRCYFAFDLKQHVFYQDESLRAKYPRQFALPALNE